MASDGTVAGPLGDLDPEEFRRHGHEVVDWIAGFLAAPERYPVLARVKPGDVRGALPGGGAGRSGAARPGPRGLRARHPPGHHALEPSGLLRLLRDQRLRPRDPRRAPLRRAQRQRHALAHVAGRHGAGGGRPRLAAEAPRPSRRLPRRHLRHRVDLDPLRARRGARGRRARRPGAGDGRARRHPAPPRLHVRAGAQLRREGRDRPRLRARGRAEDPDRRASSGWIRRRSPARSAEDRAAGWRPIAVCATVGTTGTTSVDPVPAIADIAAREGLWLHVDAAYGGVAAILPERREVLAGCDRADSIVVNPHKWLFTPDRLLGPLLPAPRRAQARLHPRALVPADAGRERGRELHGLGAAARAPLPGAEALDGAPRVRPVRHRGAAPRAHAARAALRRVGRRRSGLGAHRPRPVQHGRLPAPAPGLGRRRPAAGHR